MNKNKENLYGWIFTYNPYTENYRCCRREDYLKFFSEPEENFLRSKKLETLEELIIKIGDDKEALNRLLNLSNNKVITHDR